MAPDGKAFLSVGGGNSSVRLWNLASCREIRNFGGKQMSFPTWAAFTPDCKTLATVHQDEKVLRLWDVATGKELHRLTGHGQLIAGLAVAPDGCTIASGDYNGVLCLWDVATGKKRWHGKIGSSLDEMAFSPDGRTLAWGSQHEKTVHLWDARRHTERGQLLGHYGAVTGLAFAADNTRLASVNTDGTGLVWDMTRSWQTKPSPVVKLSPGAFEGLWADLADTPERAYRAMNFLRSDPDEAVALLRKHLHLVPRPDPAQLGELVRDLDSSRFATREKAMQELETLGDGAEAAVSSSPIWSFVWAASFSHGMLSSSICGEEAVSAETDECVSSVAEDRSIRATMVGGSARSSPWAFSTWVVGFPDGDCRLSFPEDCVVGAGPEFSGFSGISQALTVLVPGAAGAAEAKLKSVTGTIAAALS